MKEKNKVSIGFGIIIILWWGIATSPYTNLHQVNKPINPSTSAIPTLPIYIDDLDPNNDWDTFVSANPWVMGSGVPGDPYIIFQREINANGGIYGINIKDSDAYFYIYQCVIYNTDPYEVSAGIYLENITHGKIIECELCFNGFFGIEAVYCNQLDILSNIIHDNWVAGIHLGGCTDCIIQENNISEPTGSAICCWDCQGIGIYLNSISSNMYDGISFNNTHFSEIEVNDICSNFDGIYLAYSGHNEISRNKIYDNGDSGILLAHYSHYNSITSNTLWSNFYCILVGLSCENNNFFENGDCPIYQWNDIPPPSGNNTDDPGDDPDSLEPFLGIEGIIIASVAVVVIICAITIVRKRMDG